MARRLPIDKRGDIHAVIGRRAGRALIWRAPALLCLLASSLWAGDLLPVRLRCEYAPNPLAVESPRPRLSWWCTAADPAKRGLRQSAFQILVDSSPERLLPDQADLWDSGKLASDQSAHIEYSGKPLASRQRCWWKVRLWDQ